MKYQLRLDEDLAIALRRIANAEERSVAAQLRHMIRQEAARRGLWPPKGHHLSAVKTPEVSARSVED